MRRKQKSEDTRQWYRYQFFGNANLALAKERRVINSSIANISLSGLGVYSPVSVGKGRRVKLGISFVDKDGKVREDYATGKVDWQKKFKDMYLVGIKFEEELSVAGQPCLMQHLTYLINTQHMPQPYKDKRIAML